MDMKPLPVIAAVIILVIAGGALWFVLSRQHSATPSPAPQTQPSVSGGVSDHGQYYDINADYPVKVGLSASAGSSANAKAVAIMRGFVEQEAANFKEQNNLNSLSPNDIQMMHLGGDRKYSLDIKYKTYSSPQTVSFVFTMFADTLGAHPNTYYRTFTFNRATGEGLVLGQLFSPDANYIQVLSDKSRAQLLAHLAEAEQVDPSQVDTMMLNAGTTPDEDNFQSFYLDGQYFVIIFPPYQVAPYAAGEQEVRLSRGELSSILKADYK